jgi:hypothetical protein
MKVLEKIGNVINPKPVYNEVYALEQMTKLGAAESALQSIENEVSAKKTAIDADYAEDLGEWKKEVEKLTQNLLNYAEANKEKFEKSKSIKIGNGKIGWRSSVALGLLEGYDWDIVAENCKTIFPKLAPKKTIIDLNKSGLKELGNADLEKIGCVLNEKNDFFAKSK